MSWVRRLGLSSRLALVIAALALVALGTASWLLVRLSTNLAMQAQREQGGALLQSLAPSCARALAVNDLARLDDLLAETVLEVRPSWTRILYVEAYDASGRPLLRAGDGGDLARGADRLLDPSFLDCALRTDAACWQHAHDPGGASLLFLSTPANSGLRWGTLVAALDLQAFEGSSQQWARKALAFIVVLAMALYLITWFGLSRMVIAPLSRLAHAAQRMAGGDLGVRVQLERSDELGQLGSVFDSMAERLQAHTAELEHKVAERSARIRRQNEELERVNANLAGINAQLERLATTDALTGLHNRRYLQQALEFEIARGQRAEHPFCLLMMDIDHFKRVNDTYGHAVGDRVLVQVATVLQENLRNIDLRARWGGEEFVALLLDSQRDAGLQTAEKIRAVLEQTEIHAGLDEPVRVTISIGVACSPADGVEEHKLFAHADAALYRAKEGGRNRVEG
mgnify:CR=1 FL=1